MRGAERPRRERGTNSEQRGEFPERRLCRPEDLKGTGPHPNRVVWMGEGAGGAGHTRYIEFLLHGITSLCGRLLRP